MHTPDIVLTDINLPELNGFQMADKIRMIKPDVKIIVLSADTGKSFLNLTTEEKTGINHFITKPIIFELLFTAIDECIAAIAHSS
jgi:YesN/AraC family two-component response regulator